MGLYLGSNLVSSLGGMETREGGYTLKELLVTPGESQTIIPEEGYDGFDKVTVLQARLQDKSVALESSDPVEITRDDGYYGLNKVTVDSSAVYESGYTEGHESGYTEGYTKGTEESLTKLEVLEYLESTGTQYIDTGFKHNQDTRVVMRVQATSISANAWIFEGRDSTSTARQGVFFYYSSTKLWTADFDGSGVRVAFDGIASTDELNIDYNKNVCTINGVSQTLTDADFQASYNLTLLAANTAGTVAGFLSAKLYSCQIYDNGTLVRDYVPVKAPSGDIGLFDKVNNLLYLNEGEGEFIAGEKTGEVISLNIEGLPQGCVPVPYLESNGAQYIDTKIVPTSTVFDFEITATYLGDTSTTSEICGLLGLISSDASVRIQVFAYVGYFYYGVNSTTSSGVRLDNVQHTIRYVGDGTTEYLYIDGEMVHSVTVSTTALSTNALSFYVFGRNRANTLEKPGEWIVNSLKMKIDGNLVREYIPVLNPAGGMCLLDKVDSKYYNFIEKPRYEVKTITKSGSYDSASYHGSYYAAINDSTLLLIVQGGTSTSYESIYFAAGTVPSGVSLVGQSYYSYSSMTASMYYCAIFSGITSNVNIGLNFSAVNTSSDYTTCTVTITNV